MRFYGGSINFMILQRQKFYLALMQMHHVRTIELDIHRWQPLPSPSAQRALVTEVHMYRPTIQLVVLWVGQTRILWNRQGDAWHQRIDNHQYPHNTTLWSTV